MKTTIIATINTLAILTSVFAQDTLKIDRQKAIAIGLKNRYDRKAVAYNVEMTFAVLQKTQQAWLPDIEGRADIRYNTQLQKTLIPGGLLPNFDKSGLVAIGSNQNMSFFGLTLQQTLYDPNMTNDIKLAKNKMFLEQEKDNAHVIRVKERIHKAYLNVLLKTLQHRIAVENTARNESYAQLAEGKYKNGVLIENDFLRAKLDRDNASVLENISQQQYEQTVKTLKYEMNLSNNTIIELSEQLDDIVLNEEIFDRKERTEIKQSSLKLKESELELKKIKLSVLPTVSLSANYTQQYMNSAFRFGDSGWWSPYSYLGVKLTVPISSHIKNKTTIREQQFRLDQSKLWLRQHQSDIAYETDQKQTILQDARNNMLNSRNNYSLSRKIYQNQQQQLALGIFEYINLLETEKSMHTTEQQYVQAVYDYIISLLDLQKATGNL